MNERGFRVHSKENSTYAGEPREQDVVIVLSRTDDRRPLTHVTE